MAEVTNQILLRAINSLSERVTEMHTEMHTEMATKADLEDLRSDIQKSLQVTERAVDKDALAIVDHEKRLKVVEKKLAVA